jgi:hypothetical protein
MNKQIAAGETWLVEQSVALETLTIADGGQLAAPAGKQVTLTVDGVQLAPVPGEYKNAILTVTEDYKTPVEHQRAEGFRAALYIKDGQVVAEKSVTAALRGGSFDGSSLSGVKLESQGPMFTGVIVDGGKYEIKDLDVTMNGFGGNDFAGVGTGLVVCGDADVTVDGYKVRNAGVIRNAVVVGGTAKLTVKNADIEALGGDEDQVAAAQKAVGRGMFGVPWVLGLVGNNRATNVVGKGHVTYVDSKIRAQGWGVLSTDGVDSPDELGQYTVTLDTKNCEVDLFGESGYGSYTIGSCRNTFDNTIINVPDYALVAANEYASGRFINGTVVNSKRFGVMWHQNQGGEMILDKATFNTEMAPFLIKGCYPDIQVTDSVLNAKNKVILQMIDLDDPGLAGEGVDVDTEIPAPVEGHDPANANYHDAILFGKPVEKLLTDAQATFTNMTIEGDFYNGTTNRQGVGMVMPNIPHDAEGPGPEGPGPEGPGPEGGSEGHGGMPEMGKSTEMPINLILTFRNTQVTGVLSATKAEHALKHITKADYYQLGMVTNTPCPAVNNGVLVKLDGQSAWTVTGDSYITSLELAEGAKLQAPAGKAVVLTVNGVDTPVAPGTYKGQIKVSIR